MVFAPAWPLLAAARSSPIAVPKAALNSPPNPTAVAALKPPETLKRRADFLRLAAKGRKIARPGFVLQVLRGETETPLRVGYTATKKLGNAVARNRARRRLREAVRLALAGENLAGTELVVICRQETAAIPFPTLCADLRAALAP